MRDGWVKKLSVMVKKIGLVAAGLLLALSASSMARAQTAEQAWLNYNLKGRVRMFFPANVRALGNSAEERSAVEELNRGLEALSPASNAKVGRDKLSLEL